MKTNRRGFLGLLGASAASLGVLKVPGTRVETCKVESVKPVAKVEPVTTFNDEVLKDALEGNDMSWLGVDNWLGLMYGKHEIESCGYDRQKVKLEFIDGGGMGNAKEVRFPRFKVFTEITGLGIFDAKVGGHLICKVDLPGLINKPLGPGDTAFVEKHALNVNFS